MSDKENHFRYRNGISKCYVCANCEKMFGSRYQARYCLDCREEIISTEKQKNLAAFQLRKTLFAVGHSDVRVLRDIKEEMEKEDGREFAEWVTRPVCKRFIEAKRVEEE
jgi:hypothetical protein